MTLKIYPFGVLMQRQTPQGTSEYLVDPAEVAIQLSSSIRLETGLLSPHTIYVAREGVQNIIVEHRPRRKTAIFLDGLENPLVVPLPDLLLFRATSDKKQPLHRVFAVKERPNRLDAKLFIAPLPNIYEDGRICWGSVQCSQIQPLISTSLEADWQILLGTSFGNHYVGQRSKSHPADIRQKYTDMQKRKSRVYPKKDLLPTRYTVEEIIEELLR